MLSFGGSVNWFGAFDVTAGKPDGGGWIWECGKVCIFSFFGLGVLQIDKKRSHFDFQGQSVAIFLSLSTPLAHVYLKLDYKQINVNEVSECENSLEVFLEEEKSFEDLYWGKRLKMLPSNLDWNRWAVRRWQEKSNYIKLNFLNCIHLHLNI